MDSNEKDDLLQGIDIFRVYCGMVLLSFAKHGHGLRETTARNFIARGMSSLQSIYHVWEIGNEQDAWILHRSLVDRLLHLHFLGVTDSFTDFEEYSFISMFKARDKIISNPLMRNKVQQLKEIHKNERQKYETLLIKGCKWKRPRAQDVAKQMNLSLVYDISYDYASMHVHPLSSDGFNDFQKLIEIPDKLTLPDSTVVRNSINVQSLLVQEAFNISKMRWRAIAYDFLSQIRSFAGCDDQQYITTIYKLRKVWPDFHLCEEPTTEKK